MKFNREQLLLYAVTDRAWTGKMSLLQQVEEAILGGVTMVQLREKELPQKDMEAFLEEARQMRALTERYGIPLIINDNIEAALKCGADGVHVGQSDMEAGLARKLLGPELILGVTAKTVEQAKKAQEQGADYLGSGAVFGSSTKTDARPMSMETLREICSCVSIPVVAIGGIGPENIHMLAGSKAAGAAVVSGIFSAKDIRSRTAQLVKKAKETLDISESGAYNENNKMNKKLLSRSK